MKPIPFGLFCFLSLALGMNLFSPTLALSAEGGTPTAGAGAFSLKSGAFKEGERVPLPHTCLGANLSPPLQWSGAPQGTKEFALLAEDPDAPAGIWVHWLLYNIPGSRNSLPEGIFKGEKVKDVGVQGKSDFDFLGYGGPCPPPGKDHRYYFRLYALSAPLNLPPGATKAQLVDAMKGKILAETALMGLFSR